MGVLIAVEGIDKAGKTGVAQMLAGELDGSAVINTEPDDGEFGFGNEFGKLTREMLGREDVHPVALFHSFMADHHQHINDVVLPNLEDGNTVILDRYILSRYAYQSHSLSEFFDGREDKALDWIKRVQHGPGVSPMPDVTLYIDITAEESARRSSGDGEVFEESSFQEKVRQNYLSLSRDLDSFVVIDGMQSKEDVQQEALEAVKKYL